MRIQWNLLLALIFALIIALFAVVNVEPVQVKYVFGEAELPLIIVILGSALAGGIIVGSVGLFRMFLLGRQLKAAKKENNNLNSQLAELEERLAAESDKSGEPQLPTESAAIENEEEQQDEEETIENTGTSK